MGLGAGGRWISGVNLLTHPIVYAGSLVVPWPWPSAAELLVVAAEALLLGRWWRVPWPSGWLWLGTLLANALSPL